jgi:hypothetical protein
LAGANAWSPSGTVNIRPDVSVYATYQRLSYRPWYAVAEFVDNSTQNYLYHRNNLLGVYRHEGRKQKLRIEISYDQDRNVLTIYDNANGMNIEELERAVVLDRPPPDRSGRCEYGMGLKTAACWFGSTWRIRTARLGSKKELSVSVHIPDLVKKHINELEVQERSVDEFAHHTEIIIEGLYKPIKGRTSARIRDQLGSMYRQDLRTKEVEILWNGEPVSFEEPHFLEEKVDGGEMTTWRKDVKLEVPRDAHREALKALGWIGLLSPGSQRDAGFVLLRRGRVIIGGPGEGYKPVEIFGQGNTFRSQRLVGEFQMDDWPVTQAKDAFDWSGDLEESFIDELRRSCQSYMDKAEGYRERQKPVTRADMELATERTRQLFSDQRFGAAVSEAIRLPEPLKTPEQEAKDVNKLLSISEGPLQYRLQVGPNSWLFRLHWQEQLSEAHWMQVSSPQDDLIDIYLNMAHPFFAPYLDNKGFLELLQKFVMALALAEKMARETARNGLVNPGDVRMNMNSVLRRVSEIEAKQDG